MYYNIQQQQHEGVWVYVLIFGRETPQRIEDAAEYADETISAEDLHGIRHSVLYKDGKIVQIQLHEMHRLMPEFDPENPRPLAMPILKPIPFGDPPKPTLLVAFKPLVIPEMTAYAVSPNVFLVFDEDDLARLYVTDVYAVLNDVN